MLSINTIARVVVNTVRASASPASFDTGLLLVSDSNYAAARRLISYSSAAEAAAGLTGLGFGASTEVYKAAVKYFAASPAPGRLLVSCHPVSETPGEALDAVLDQTASFYGVLVVDTVSAADWLAFARGVIERMERTRNTDGEYPYIFSERTGSSAQNADTMPKKHIKPAPAAKLLCQRKYLILRGLTRLKCRI